MKSILILIRKDWIESIRSYKFLVLVLVFLLFGFMNPLTAKILPDIMPQLLPDNLPIEIPPAMPFDAWTQFFKNMTSMLMILFFILFSGTLTNEFSKNTMIPLLTKGLKRQTVIFAKWGHLVFQWTILFSINLAASWIYTVLLLPGELNHILVACLFLWLYGIFLISLLIFFSVIFMNIYGVLIGLGGVSLLLSLISIAAITTPYSPYRLGADNLLLISGVLNLSDFIFSLGLTLVLIPILLVFSIRLLDKKPL